MEQQDFEQRIAEITQKYREQAKGKTTIDELEDVAWEYHKKIGNIFMTGIAADKGDGRNLELPETLYNNSNGKKPKNKGLKKKTC
jgi:hypothetical protein